jgi:hypothetical protein
MNWEVPRRCVLLLFGALSSGCCTGGDALSIAAVELTLLNPITGGNVCDAVVVADHGATTERIEAYVYQTDLKTGNPSYCIYLIGWDSPGSYVITIAHPQFNQRSETVVAPAIGCSVSTQHVTLTLDSKE